ncbi:MAG: tetratricopeptide repeat protein [Gemmatimonadaceae bacterium]
MLRYVKFLSWAFVVISIATVLSRPAPAPVVDLPPPAPVAPAPSGPATEAGWFPRTKPFCNSLEVVTRLASDPPPAGPEGQGFGAACYALAGRIDSARAMIQRLSPAERVRAAGILFEVGHPVADMGDDRSAGPMMELVIEYWPDNYMALYHAGASEFQLGQLDRARANLQAFLRVYGANDGWTSSAQGMLGRISSKGKTPVEAVPDSAR